MDSSTEDNKKHTEAQQSVSEKKTDCDCKKAKQVATCKAKQLQNKYLHMKNRNHLEVAKLDDSTSYISPAIQRC